MNDDVIAYQLGELAEMQAVRKRGPMIDRDILNPVQVESRKGPVPRPAVERFWEKVDTNGDGGCWVWRDRPNADGYPQFGVKGKNWRAHRFAYELLVGPIPDGLTLDHLCRNTICVNPAHLEPVSMGVNVMRGNTVPARLAARTHCDNGHPYDDANTYIRLVGGGRRCKACRYLWLKGKRKRDRVG